MARLIPVVLVSAAALSVSAVPRGGGPIQIEQTAVFIEFNATDNDFGIQFFWDAEDWSKMKITGPDGSALSIKASKNLKLHGMTEGFFESAEPSAAELPMAEFFLRFPEGTYTFAGKGIEGDTLVGEAEFTHTLAAAPTNLFPAQGATVDSTAPLVVSFDAVTTDLNANPLVPARYDVVVETDHPTLGEIAFSVVLEGSVANPEATVPPEFLFPSTSYKLEVIVQEASGGNRTISETTWSTLP